MDWSGQIGLGWIWVVMRIQDGLKYTGVGVLYIRSMNPSKQFIKQCMTRLELEGGI